MKRFDTTFLMVLLLLFIASNVALGQHFEPAANQVTSHSLLIRTAEINGEALTNDDEIAVYTPGGVCAGVVVIDDDPPWGLAAFGDNPNTRDEVEGFLTGEEFAFRFWDASEEVEEELHAEWSDGPQTWQNNAVGNILRMFYFSDSAPVISFSATEHEFEIMGIDNSREWTLTITNLGFGVLTIEDASLNSQAFGTNFENEVELDIYESYDLIVNFTPPGAGNYQGTLTIVSDDPDNGETNITLTGTGTNVIEPEITFNYDEINFGEWPVGRNLAKVFNLTIGNTGTGDLTISYASVTGDDVFEADWDGEVVIKPFDEYILSVTFDPDDVDTDYEGTLTIYSDDPDNEEVVLDLMGRGILITSHFVWVRGESGVDHSQLIQEAYIDGEVLDVRDEIAVFTPGGICAGGSMLTRRAQRVGFSAWGYSAQNNTPGFRADDPIEYRIWDASAEIEYIVDPDNVDYLEGPDVYTPVATTVLILNAATPDEPVIDVSTLEIDYGEIGVNFSEEREVRIRNIGSVALRITYVESSEPDIFVTDFEVGVVLQAYEEYMLIVAFEPPDVVDYTGQIAITSNGSEDPILIDVMGLGIEPPAMIQIEDREHDFGQLEHGTEATWELLIQNIGWENVTIDSLISDNEAFTHDFGDQPVVLERDDEIIVTVTFSAAEAQEYDGILTVYSDDPDEADQAIEIALSGEGVNVPDIRLSRTLIDFGEIEIFTEDTYVLTVINDGEADLHVTNLTMGGGDGNFFDTDYDGAFTVAPNGGEHEIVITFSPAPIRAYSAEIHIFSDDLDEDDVRVRLAGVGIYVAHPPEVIHQIPDLNLEEDFDESLVADLDTIFIDANGENMEFSARTNRNGLHAEVRNNSKLWIFADANWYGSGTVTVSADDGVNRDNGGPVRSLRSAGGSTTEAINNNRVARSAWGVGNPARDEVTEIEFDVNVEAQNDEPVWIVVPDPISVSETTEIAFTVEGEDVDDDALTITYSSDDIPDAVTFNDNNDGTADFSWTPSYDDAGNYTATFMLSDAEFDIEADVEIEVTNVNREPVWDDIEDQYEVAENDELNVTIAGSDPDGDALTISWASDDLPEEFNFTDNEDGSGTMFWQTGYEDAGEYSATFTISDGEAEASYDVAIVVTNTNRLPEWTDVPEEESVIVDVDAEELIEFSITGTDADGTGNLEITFTSDDIPEAAGFTDNGNGEGVFSWTVTIDDAGSYTATFTLSDGEDETVAETRIIVIGTNQPPEWVEVDNTDEWPARLEVDEAQTLAFTVSGTDPDEDDVANLEITYSSNDLPDAVTFEDQGEGVGAFSWEPGYLDAGEYTATFTLTDGIYNVDGRITIVVNNVNRDPDWVDIPGETVVVSESEQVQFDVVCSDPDEDDELTLTYNSDNLPDAVVFEDNGGGNGSFTWDTGFLDAGQYTVTFTVNDGYTEITSNEVDITINNRNAPPEWTDYPESISAEEGDLIDVDVVAGDIDEDDLTLTARDLPEGCGFTDNHNGTGILLWQTDFQDAGEYTVTLTVSDAEYDVEIEIPIEVTNVNQAPEWVYAPDRVNIDENQDWSLTVRGEDSDGDDLTIEYESDNLPDAATFEDNRDGTATLSWQPDYNDAGQYEVTFILSDGLVPNRTLVRITVRNVDRAPVWDEEPPDVTVDEGDRIEFSMAGSDPDGDDLTILFSSDDLPDAAEFMDHGDGTGDFSWQTGFDDGGNYTATFTLSSNDLEAVMEVNISIGNVNHNPVWVNFPPSQHVDPGDLIEFTLTGQDEDEDDLTITYTPDDNLPAAGDVFTDNGDGTAVFSWQTGGADEGSYIANFTLSDGIAEVTRRVIITIGDVNQPPAWINISGLYTINENAVLNFNVSGGDPDDDALTITTSELPAGAQFTDNHNGTGNFNWRPNYNQSGQYVITFTLSDGNYDEPRDVRIRVNNVNRAPVWSANMPPRSPSGTENSTLSFVVRGTDPDGDELTIRMVSDDLPDEAGFTDNSNGSGDFTWETTYDDAGTYDATFILSDGTAEVSGVSSIRVNNVNRPPSWVNPQQAITANEGQRVGFRMRGTDPDGLEDLRFSFDEDGLPGEAEFIDYGEGDAYFTWFPDYNDEGEYTATFTLSDGVLSVEHEVPITIEDVNRSPYWVNVPDEIEGDEDEWISFNVTGDDLDDEDELRISYNSDDIPDAASFVDIGNGRGYFWWKPTFDESGEYTAMFTIVDNKGLEVTESTTITVNPVNRAPVWDNLPSAVRVNENEELVLDVSGSDPDGDDLTLSYAYGNVPDGWNFTDNEDGTGSFTWTPNYEESGDYLAVFSISDGELSPNPREVIIAVSNVNRPPQIFSTEVEPGNEIDETDRVTISIESGDPDGDDLKITWESETVSNNIEFYDNEDGTATLFWTSGYEDGGEHTITLTSSDGRLEDSEDIVITVNEVNRAPFWSDVPEEVETNEEQAFDIQVRGDDPDGTGSLTIEYSSDDLPEGVNFTDLRNGRGRLTWRPTLSDAGEYTAVFTLSDGEYEDVAEMTVIVNNVNREPVWDGDPTAVDVDEAQSLEFTVSGNDDDADDALTITYNMHDLPDGIELTDNHDGTAGINWTPGYEDAGEYTAVFTLSDGYTSVDKEVVITVNDVNRAPQWTAVPEETITNNETDLIQFTVRGFDPDGDNLTIYDASDNLPVNAVFTDEGNGFGSFAWQTTYDDAGEYSITLTLSDGVETDEVTVDIVVNDVNRAPEWTNVPGRVNGRESFELEFSVIGRDLDGDDLSITYSSDDIPDVAEFTDNSDGTASLVWTPGSGEAGQYSAHFILSDGELTAEADVTIDIAHVNREPYFVSIPDAPSFLESDEWVSFEIVVGDSDGGDLTVTYASDDLPEDESHGLGEISADTREFNWVIGYEQAGEYVVTFTVSDGEAEVSEDVTIIIVNTSRPPVWTIVPGHDLEATETDQVHFWLKATDPDTDDLAIQLLNQRNLPEDIDFNFVGWVEEDEAWAAEFTWQTSYDDEGQYTLQFNVTDHESNVSYDVTLNISGRNRDPVYDQIPGNIAVNDNELIEFNIVASDPDGDDIELTISNRSVLPDPDEAGYELVNNNDDTWTFNWDPGYDYTSNDWSVTFILSDGVENIRRTVSIVIENVNRPPDYTDAPPDDIAWSEGNEGGFYVRAADPDGSLPTISFFSDLPDGIAVFTYDRQNQEGLLEWSVDNDVVDHGDTLSYTACFVLSDAESSDTTAVPITIYDVDQPPYATGEELPDRVFNEDDDEILAFNVYDRFTDPDGPEDLAFDYSQDPELCTIRLEDNGDFFIQPILNVTGESQIIVTVIEDFDLFELADTFMVTITPENDEGGPGDGFFIIFPGFQYTMDEDGSFDALADLDTLFIDPEGDSLAFDFSGGDSLGIGIDGENVLSLNPVLNWYGVQDFTIIVEDFPPNGAPRRDDIAEYVITVTVNAVNDDPPVVANEILLTLDEGFAETEVANLDDIFFDPDGQSMTYAVTAEAPLYAYIDYYKNLYIGINDDNYFGEPGVTLTATDAVDSMVVYDFTITVLNINDPPIRMNEIDDREYKEDSGPWTIVDLDSVFYDPDGVGDPLYFDVETSDDMVTWELTDENVLILTAADNMVADNIEITVFCNDTLEGALAASPSKREKATGPVRTMRSVSSRSDASYAFGFSKIDVRRDTEINDVFTLTILAVNDPPTWAAGVPATAAGDETTAINFTLTAEDIDIGNEGDALILTMTDDGGTAASGAAFTDNGDGTGDYTWQTDYTAAGEYTVVFQAADQAGAVITHTVMITVGNMNRAPVVAATVPDFVFDEGGLMNWVVVANLDTIFTDPDADDILTYQVGAPAAPWQAQLTGSVLSIMAPENYNGAAYPFIISAGDNNATVTDTFTVTVNSINDPPTAFGLIEPVNNYIVINPWVQFKWQPSVDEVEDSTIVYTLTIVFDDTTHAPLVRTGLTVTEAIMGRIEMYNSDDPDFTGEDTTYAQWSIVATDGEAIINSTQNFTLIIPPVGVIEDEPELPPTSLKLGPVYPNPFNDQTRIEFELPWDGLAEVTVYDLAGRVVKTLVNNNMTVGRYTARWDGYNEYGKRAAAGLYLCRLKVGDSDRMVQIVLLR